MKQLIRKKRDSFAKTILISALFFCMADLSAQPAKTDAVEVKALDSQAGAASLFTLNFTLSDTLQPDAVIEVKFPNGFDLSRVNLAGSATINGGFKVSVQGQSLKISRKGKGAVKYPGEKVDLKFSTVVNSSNTTENYLITVNLKKRNVDIPLRELKGSFTVSRKQKK